MATPGPSRSRRKQAENWDDDFEFSLPRRGPANGSSPSSAEWDESPPPRTTELPATASTPQFPASIPSSVSTGDVVFSAAPRDPLGPAHRLPRARSGSTTANGQNRKLVKRHPSTSFVHDAGTGNHVGGSNPSLGPPLAVSANRSSPNLHASTPREIMPPPPVPARSDVRVAAIPLSPERGFWRRMSSGPGRKRSGSLGRQQALDRHPPVPPLPVNLRSSSATSAMSAASVTSATSATSAMSASSSQPGSSLAPRLSAILHRSSSNLSRKSKDSGKGGNGKGAYYTHGDMSTSSVSISAPSPRLPTPTRPPNTAPLPSSHSFSRGFHLPSSTPGSPYNPANGFSSESIHTALPPSTPEPLDSPDPDQTPPRRRIRPVSLAPTGFKTPDDKDAAAAASSTTFRRLNSLKKHGRRLSGGWKFSAAASETPSLDTVHGSPTKPVTGTQRAHEAQRATVLLRDDDVSGVAEQLRVESPTHPRDASSAPNPRVMQRARGEGQDKAAARSRRKSWNDFVIPREVMEKQRELKEGIGAVKQFAAGVQTLKAMIADHEIVRDQLGARGTALEAEYAQWWEMATVLIDVGSTDTDSSSPRSRRASLAASAATSNSPDNGGAAWAGAAGSTGREMSKRQLEVLRGMLQTPRPALVGGSVIVSGTNGAAGTSAAGMPNRPGMGSRQASTVSVKSSSRVVTGSPDSTYIVPSTSFPSPATADELARAQRAGRRASRAGLAGLKDFLRSLRPTTPARHEFARPAPIKVTTSTTTTVAMGLGPAASTAKASTPRLPTSPTMPSLTSPAPASPTADIFYPTQRSFAALGPVPARRSPDKGDRTKRPSIRNIFRTSSGNWSDLVRADANANGQPGTPTSPPPVPPPLVRATTSDASIRSVSPDKSVRSGSGASQAQAQSQVQAQSTTRSRAASVVTSASRASSATASAPPSAFDSTTLSSLTLRSVSNQSPESAPKPKGVSITPLTTPFATITSASSGAPWSPGADADQTLRPKSRASASAAGLGLGHPTPPPAAAAHGLAPAFTARSQSDSADLAVALTPDNLPVLLDFLRQCERKLGEWRAKADGVVAAAA